MFLEEKSVLFLMTILPLVKKVLSLETELLEICVVVFFNSEKSMRDRR